MAADESHKAPVPAVFAEDQHGLAIRQPVDDLAEAIPGGLLVVPPRQGVDDDADMSHPLRVLDPNLLAVIAPVAAAAIDHTIDASNVATGRSLHGGPDAPNEQLAALAELLTTQG